MYALVVYIPPPLSSFLDALRLELIPGCSPHAHVSVLAPRVPGQGVEEACAWVETRLPSFDPFEIAGGEVELFVPSQVVYIGLSAGGEAMRRLNAALNGGPLAFPDAYAYHPHITLAQEIPPGSVDELFALAARRWAEYRGPRGFSARTVTFVRHNGGMEWEDVREFRIERRTDVSRL